MRRPLLALAGLALLRPGADPHDRGAAAPEPQELEADELSLLQQRHSVSHPAAAAPVLAASRQASPSPSPEHYWPHARGRVGRYSQTPYGSRPGDLNRSLAWSWHAPKFGTMLFGSLIDSQRNIYAAGIDGVWKLSPAGHVLWHNNMSTEMPTLVGETLFGMRMADCLAFALSLETGKLLWTRQVWPNNGLHGDFVEVHNGVAVVAVGAAPGASVAGGPSTKVAALSATDGRMLWNFQPDCPLWNIMALFPDNETTIFNDYCGGVYRVGLNNGTLLWHTPGSTSSFTDGGSMLGPDGSVYTCSNPSFTTGQVTEPGVLRKHRLQDGATLWEVMLPYPCVNFPAVSFDGSSVIVAPGALAIEAKTKLAMSMPADQREAFYKQQASLVRSNQQRAFYHLPDLEAAIMGFDSATGALQWRHDVRPFGGLAFAGDERRAWDWVQDPTALAHCWPSQWSGPTVDRDGTVYIGRSSGELYAYSPSDGLESTFHTGDGILMAGAAFAPGIMVFTTCSSVHAFHMP